MKWDQVWQVEHGISTALQVAQVNTGKNGL